MFQIKVVEKITTHFMFSYFFFENRAVYEIIWKNSAERGRLQMKTWLMRIAYRIPKATKAHSKCVILIAFPLQRWLHEDAWMLRYTYSIFSVWFIFPSFIRSTHQQTVY